MPAMTSTSGRQTTIVPLLGPPSTIEAPMTTSPTGHIGRDGSPAVLDDPAKAVFLSSDPGPQLIFVMVTFVMVSGAIRLRAQSTV